MLSGPPVFPPLVCVWGLKASTGFSAEAVLRAGEVFQCFSNASTISGYLCP
jgi:hypothetical protein